MLRRAGESGVVRLAALHARQARPTSISGRALLHRPFPLLPRLIMNSLAHELTLASPLLTHLLPPRSASRSLPILTSPTHHLPTICPPALGVSPCAIGSALVTRASSPRQSTASPSNKNTPSVRRVLLFLLQSPALLHSPLPSVALSIPPLPPFCPSRIDDGEARISRPQDSRASRLKHPPAPRHAGSHSSPSSPEGRLPWLPPLLVLSGSSLIV